jgi:hypothetical protein
MKKDNIIRVGDCVRIIEPHIFVRCGYPLSFEDAVKVVEEKYQKEVDSMLEKIGFREFYDMTILGETVKMKMKSDGRGTTEDKIIRALAYEYVSREGFGGKERKIYTDYKEELKGKEYTVTRKFVKKTGTYFPPSEEYHSYYDYSEYEYEPGGLVNEQTHVMLDLYEGYTFTDEHTITIEKCYVKKIQIDEEEF